MLQIQESPTSGYLVHEPAASSLDLQGRQDNPHASGAAPFVKGESFIDPGTQPWQLQLNFLRHHVERESFLNLRCEVKHGDNAGTVGSDFQRIGRMIGEIV